MVDNPQSQNPSIQRIHGVACRPGTTREMIEALPGLVAREKDIYVVSYPKAGKVVTTLCILSTFVPVASSISAFASTSYKHYSF